MSSDAVEEVEVNETVLQKLFDELDALPDSHMALSSKAGLNPRFFQPAAQKAIHPKSADVHPDRDEAGP